MNQTYFDCDVARDLMPLVIDDAASGTSRGIVEAHLKECQDCRRAMEEMRRELAEGKASPEDGDFVRVVKNTGKKLRRKKTVATVCLVAGLVSLVVGIYAWLANHNYRDIELTPENAVFALDEDGYLTVTHTVDKGYGFVGLGTGEVADSGVVYFSMSRTRWQDASGEKPTGTIRNTMDWICWNGEALCLVYPVAQEGLPENLPPEAYIAYDEQEPIQELRIGTPDEYFVLYRAGDVLTPGEVIEIAE